MLYRFTRLSLIWNHGYLLEFSIHSIIIFTRVSWTSDFFQDILDTLKSILSPDLGSMLLSWDAGFTRFWIFYGYPEFRFFSRNFRYTQFVFESYKYVRRSFKNSQWTLHNYFLGRCKNDWRRFICFYGFVFNGRCANRGTFIGSRRFDSLHSNGV